MIILKKTKKPIILKNNVVLNEKDNEEDETIQKIKDVLEIK